MPAKPTKKPARTTKTSKATAPPAKTIDKLAKKIEAMFKHDMIVFGRAKTSHDAEALLALELGNATSTPKDFDLFFPHACATTLASCRALLPAGQFIDVSVASGEATLAARFVDMEFRDFVPVHLGRLSTVRNWFRTVAEGPAQFHFVAREKRRPINAWRANVSAKGIVIRRLEIPQFDAVTSLPEYEAIAAR